MAQHRNGDGITASRAAETADENNDGDNDPLDLPLSALFARGYAAYRATEAGTASQAQLEDGVASLRRAAGVARQMSIFSRNEDADDVATGDLKYLLLPFLLAQVVVQLRVDDRLSLLAEAQRASELFLSQCESYGLVPAHAKAARDRAEPPDPATARAEKIARFKRDKEIAAQLDAIEQRRARRQGRHAQSGKSPASTWSEDTHDAYDAEEDERAGWLLRIRSAVYKAMDAQPLLATEAALVVLSSQRRDEAGAVQADSADSAVVDALERVSMASQRERLRSDVFRPSHILPTMTIEQFGELERQRMEEAARKQADADARAAAAKADSRSDDEAEEDARVAKARAWDDWKDDHPFGYGNSRLRPCGR